MQRGLHLTQNIKNMKNAFMIGLHIQINILQNRVAHHKKVTRHTALRYIFYYVMPCTIDIFYEVCKEVLQDVFIIII